jgi:hypothetical protein
MSETALVERPKTELAPTSEQVPAALPAVPTTETGTLLNIIERAAFDPNVSAEKITTLVNLARSVKADEAKAAYTREMLKVKLELPIIEKRGLIKIHEKGKEKTDAYLIQTTPYPKWEDIDAAITPILNRHGFTLTHKTGYLEDGKVLVTAVVTHELGHCEESVMALPLDTSGSKNNVQATGSSIAYGKRYTAGALLNLHFKGEDDDGKTGGDPGKLTAEQVEKVNDLIARVKADPELFCKFMGADSVPDILAKDYEKAITNLNLKGSKAGQTGTGK